MLACQSIAAQDGLWTPGFHCDWEILSLICETITHLHVNVRKMIYV